MLSWYEKEQLYLSSYGSIFYINKHYNVCKYMRYI